jgi:hypothetical protein
MRSAEWKHGEGKRSHVVRHASEGHLNYGGIEGAIRHTTFLERPGHRMVIKQFEILNAYNKAAAKEVSRKRAEVAAYRHTVLKRIGIPVPTTYRLHETEPEILMTDLSADDTRRVLTANNDLNNGEHYSKDMLNMRQVEVIIDEVQGIAARASHHGIHIAGDAYFFVTPRTQSDEVRVFVADYGGCLQFPARTEEEVEKTYQETLRVARSALTDLFLRTTPMSKEQVERLLDEHDFPRPIPDMWNTL